jgi:hypothetical protein
MSAVERAFADRVNEVTFTTAPAGRTSILRSPPAMSLTFLA